MTDEKVLFIQKEQQYLETIFLKNQEILQLIQENQQLKQELEQLKNQQDNTQQEE